MREAVKNRHITSGMHILYENLQLCSNKRPVGVKSSSYSDHNARARHAYKTQVKHRTHLSSFQILSATTLKICNMKQVLLYAMMLTLVSCVTTVRSSTSSFKKCDTTSTLLASFDPSLAGGASGTIGIDYSSYKSKINPLYGKINVDIDVSNLNTAALEDAYPECDTTKMRFGWHLHVLWNNGNASSGFMSDCSSDQTGGHYDPTFACGPASQYSRDEVCVAQNKTYDCTSETYVKSGISCEVGDFSGKFGALEASPNGKISETYQDFFIPPLSNYNLPYYQTPEVAWNFILHLACPEASNPRVLCAVAKLQLE